MTGKGHGSQNRQRRPPRQPVKSPWWKRPLVWAGSVIGALVIAIATAFGTGIGQDLFSALFRSSSPEGAPVTVESATYVSGEVYAFPQEITARQLKIIDTSTLPLESFGGVNVQGAEIQIVLSGNDTQAVVIAGMQTVKHCAAPLTGTLFESTVPGPSVDTRVGFNLDNRLPIAQDLEDNNPNADFFADHTISLRQGETQTLLVVAETRQQYCQFTFKLIVDTSNGQVAEPITNNGKSFEVTAAVGMADYKEVDINGKQVNPKTYAQGK